MSSEKFIEMLTELKPEDKIFSIIAIADDELEVQTTDGEIFYLINI